MKLQFRSTLILCHTWNLDIIVFFYTIKLSKTITYLNTRVKAAVNDLNAGNHDMMNVL